MAVHLLAGAAPGTGDGSIDAFTSSAAALMASAAALIASSASLWLAIAAAALASASTLAAASHLHIVGGHEAASCLVAQVVAHHQSLVPAMMLTQLESAAPVMRVSPSYICGRGHRERLASGPVDLGTRRGGRDRLRLSLQRDLLGLDVRLRGDGSSADEAGQCQDHCWPQHFFFLIS